MIGLESDNYYERNMQIANSPLHFSPTGSIGVTLNLEQLNLKDVPGAGANVQRHLDSGK